MHAPASTLADLERIGYHAVPIAQVLQQQLSRCRVQRLDPFPEIYGLPEQKRRVLEILAAGRPVLLTGAYGVAKTEIAKQLLDLLDAGYHLQTQYRVCDCPIQEDPATLLTWCRYTRAGGPVPLHQPCPICRCTLAQVHCDTSRIAVAPLSRLEEGTGFARVQGSADVLPEELIGTYNLLRLAEIGDPFDPRVFEPGKIGQANRGLLFVDELGKLSEAAQHALIQAGQERAITPAKSRQTFPVDVLIVATVNPADEEYICGAVRDRMVGVRIPVVSRDDEVRIVYKETGRLTPRIYLPLLFVRWAVDIVRSLRGDERLELGPRASINSGLVARSAALFEHMPVASGCQMREGVYTALLGKASHDDIDDVQARIDQLAGTPGAYVQRALAEIDLSALAAHERWARQPVTGQLVRSLITAGQAPDDLVRLTAWIATHEPVPYFRIHDVVAAYLVSVREAEGRGC